MTYTNILKTHSNSKTDITISTSTISARINRTLDKSIKFINTHNLKNNTINYIFYIKHAYKAKQFIFAVAEYIIDLEKEKKLPIQKTIPTKKSHLTFM